MQQPQLRLQANLLQFLSFLLLLLLLQNLYTRLPQQTEKQI